MKVRKCIELDNIPVGFGRPCFIVAEIGSNQNKSKTQACRLIDLAASKGVNAVKFQTLKPDDIAIPLTPANTYGESDYTKGKKFWSEVLEDFVLPFEWHEELFNYARSKKIIPFSTPESPEAVTLLEKIGCPFYKVASMDINYLDLLKKIAQTGKPVILSAGIATDKDISNALRILRRHGANQIALLHCVSDYPPENSMMSLGLIKKYRETFKIPVGFSDHCPDNLFSFSALSLGACIIEKHITLNKKQSGPDHHFALDGDGLTDLVKTIRKIEKALPINPLLLERKKQKKVQYGRSIVILKSKKKGEIILEKDLDFKRPGFGIPPTEIGRVIGKTLVRNLKPFHVLEDKDFRE